MCLGNIARNSFRVKNVALPAPLLQNDAEGQVGGEESEHSDYNDDDFQDLMSVKQIE